MITERQAEQMTIEEAGSLDDSIPLENERTKNIIIEKSLLLLIKEGKIDSGVGENGDLCFTVKK